MGGRDGGGTTSKAGGSAEGKNCEIGLLLLMENMLHQLMTCFINNMYILVFPKIGVPQNGWFIRENPIKMDALGGNTPIFGNTNIYNRG